MRFLSELRREDRDIIGAKATTLGELHGHGLRIPAGFVITDEVFRSESKLHPGHLAQLVVAACQRLDPMGESTYAIRSCAEVEDGSIHSHAGQFETYLNVPLTGIAESAKLIWRDCHTKSGGRSSVIVQKMVRASQAGVIFTVNPVSGDHGESVIEVVDGLGDQLVGGAVTPTRYIVEVPDRTTHERLGPGRARLTPGQIFELVEIGRIANLALDLACELEWAIAGGRVFVLQCRPITALPTSEQMLPTVKALSGYSRYRQQYESRNARPWYTVTSVGAFGRSLSELTGFEYRDIISVTDSAMRTRGFHDVRELGMATEYFADYWRDSDRVAEFLALCDSGFAQARDWLDGRASEDCSAASTPDLIEQMRRAEELFVALFRTMVVTQPQHVEPLEVNLRELLNGEGDPEDAIVAATRCTRPLPIDAEEFELQELRRRVRVGLDPASLNQELDRFTVRHGWIAAVESGEPYGREHYRSRLLHEPLTRTQTPPVDMSPEAVRVGFLIAELGNYRLWNRYYFMAVRYHVQQIIDVLVARSGLSLLKFATIPELLEWHSLGQVDELTIAARRSGYVGVLINGTTTILVDERAAVLSRQAQEPVEVEPERPTIGIVVAGDCARAGRVTGRVRVVSFVTDDYEDEVSNFRSGEILVTGMTRPQIAHLCDRAAAIVTDEGGITCHAAVIGREHGIPTLVATHDATKVLRTGDLVHVDAHAGRLTVLSRGPRLPILDGQTGT